jgi:hypothetical protein
MKTLTPEQLYRRRILLMREHFKSKTYKSQRGAFRAIDRLSYLLNFEQPFIFCAPQWSDNLFRVEIPVIKMPV